MPSNFHDLPVSNDPLQILAHAGAETAGLPVTVLPIPSHAETRGDFHPTPRIFVAQQGHGRRWLSNSGRSQELHTRPRMIEMLEAEIAFDHARWEGVPGRCVLVEFPDTDVDAITDGRLRSLRLRTEHELFDDRVSRLALEIAQEALFQGVRGELYLEGLCIALVGTLAATHTLATQNIAPSSRTLSAPQRKRISELVATEFGSALSLRRMAREINLSPHHFARLFKATFGTTPHDHVQQVRVDAAIEALQSTKFPTIAAVAQACGFSSHSHMSSLVKRHTGATPAELRRTKSAKN
jgi:AraC family transcriptional regulator